MILWHWFFSYLHLTLRRGSVVPRGKERETKMVFCLRGSCLSFCKGCLLSFAIEKCRAIWEGKADLIFSLHSLTPHALKEREQRKQQDSRSFSTVTFLFHCRLHFSAVNPPSHWCSLIRCWYETLLVVFVWVLRPCLIIVSSCAFYGYWCECVVFFMLKNHILVCVSTSG